MNKYKIYGVVMGTGESWSRVILCENIQEACATARRRVEAEKEADIELKIYWIAMV